MLQTFGNNTVMLRRDCAATYSSRFRFWSKANQQLELNGVSQFALCMEKATLGWRWEETIFIPGLIQKLRVAAAGKWDTLIDGKSSWFRLPLKGGIACHVVCTADCYLGCGRLFFEFQRLRDSSDFDFSLVVFRGIASPLEGACTGRFLPFIVSWQLALLMVHVLSSRYRNTFSRHASGIRQAVWLLSLNE